MAKKFHLERPELADELKNKQASAQRGRDHQRLSAVRLAMSGELTLAQIAKAVGRARSTVAEWMRVARGSGLEALLALHQGRGRAPQLPGKAHKELRTGLRRGRWRRLKDAQQWLAERHQVEMGLGGVRYWVKKAGAVLRVPLEDPRPARPGTG
jgi:transposase